MANKATSTPSGAGRQSRPAGDIAARKRLIVAAISACFVSAPAWSNPTGPQLVNGSASFNQAGQLLTVTNSNGAIINWNTFSIGANETTRFNQASAASSVLNRVVTSDPSVLLGTLSSNGRVWLVNPAGIMVGQGARIDVAGFVASTLNVRNEDFLAGRLNFGATPNAGKIENHGQITTPSGGSVYLIAPAVENHGIINAPNGEVVLAAGQTVQLVDTGTPGVKVDITGAEGNATNLGEIVAEAGRIGMAGVLVKSSGTLNASSVAKEGGRIFLKATKNIELADTSAISADGTKGGQIAAKTEDNGQISGTLSARGSLSAQGDGSMHSGGFVETSAAKVDLKGVRVATRGGEWLIDPNDFTIGVAGDIDGATLASNLGGGDVTIQSSSGAVAGNGDIFVNDAVAKTGPTDTTLTLAAERSIVVNAPISSSNSKLHVTLQAHALSDTAPGNVSILSDISTNGGNLIVAGGVGAAGNAVGDALTVNGITLAGATLDSGAGSITLRGQGGPCAYGCRGIDISGSTTIQSTSGAISLNGFGGTLANASSDDGVQITGSTVTTNSGAVSINGTGSLVGSYYNSGVVIGAGTTISANSGSVSITGTGGGVNGYNRGILIQNGANILSTGTAAVTLDGTGGGGGNGYNQGVVLEATGTTVSSITGAISITGTGTGSGNDNYGVLITDCTVTTNSGAVSISGTGSLMGSYINSGVVIGTGATISAYGGSLSITGIGGGSSSYDRGILIQNGAHILSTGTATVTLEGTGGGGNDHSQGIVLEANGTAVSSITGAISITGIGTGPGSDNYGVLMQLGSSSTGPAVTSTGAASISITGTGGGTSPGIFTTNSGNVIGGASATGPISLTALTNDISLSAVTIGGAGSANLVADRNILLNGATISGSPGNPLNITLQARATNAAQGNVQISNSNISTYGGSVLIGGGSDPKTMPAIDYNNNGVDLNYASIVTGGGKLEITGAGGDGGEGNSGIGIHSATLDTSKSGGVGGTVILNGTGGNGLSDNYGVYLYSTNVTTGGGALSITGSGGGAGSDNYGIYAYNATLDTSYGGGTGGTVTLNGTGGNGTGDNYGVYLDSTNVTTGGGALSITGSGSGAGSDNYGIYAYDAALDTSHGGGSGGTVKLNGTGGNGTGYNYGVYLDSTNVTTGGGALSITGLGGGAGSDNYGIYTYNATLDTSTGDGSPGGAVTLSGFGGGSVDGFDNHAVYLDSSKLFSSGDLNVTGVAGPGTNSYDIYVSGNVVLRADSNGTGVGKVIFGSSTVTVGGEGGHADIYYNPDSYATNDPTSSDAAHDPYSQIAGSHTAWMLVNDVNHLQDVNSNLEGNYALGKNIDASAATGFVPLGNNSTRFAGQFDGLDHTIGGLAINLPSAFEVGLFGVVDSGGTVRDVGLAGGGVIGAGNAGNIAGTNYGHVVNAFASGNVTGGSTLGGLVGANYGNVSNSYATGNVTSTHGNVGGLVGYNGGGSISNSYASGTVTGVDGNVGGLLGHNESGGSVSYSYAIGSVSGSSEVGGLVGRNNTGSSISNTYAAGSVTGTGANVGGLVGINSGTVSDSFWDTTTSGASTGIGGGTTAGATGMATTDMMALANFTSATPANGNANPGWDFTNTWWMSDGNTRPFLRSEWSTAIHNAHQLQLMAIDLGSSYKLSNDIDMQAELASGMWNAATGFVPVGNNSGNFIGQFDGRNHIISNLVINRPGEYDVGLFGYVNGYSNSGGVVKNVGLAGGSVTGYGYVGALAGETDYATVENSYSTASVVANYSYAGGLVGRQYAGRISKSHATGDVTDNGRNNVGGLVGSAEWEFGIYDSYATGKVTSISGELHGSNVGGLVGNADRAADTIAGSYATGDVEGGNNVGGLIGRSRAVRIMNTYATGNVTGISSVGGLVGSNDTYSAYNSDISNSYAAGTVTGNSYVGGLAGQNYGTIDGSHSTSRVIGTAYTVGGLVGDNEGSISNSYATGGGPAGGVSGSYWVGGLVGYNNGSIDRSYSSAVVYASDYSAGGLVGLNEDSGGSISNSYATGSATSNNYVGGLVGKNYGTIDRTYSTGAVVASDGSDVGGLAGSDGSSGGISNSYWNIETSGQMSSSGGIGKTSAEMMQAATFSGWSIANSGGSNAAWRIYEGSTTPLLTNFLTPITVSANDASKIYDKTAFAGNGVTYSVANATLLGTPSFGGAAASAVNVGSYAINPTGLYSDQQGYDISYAQGTLIITARPLSVTATGVNKVYDATTNATVNLGDNRLAGDVLTLSYGGASFNDKNVGVAKTVNVNGVMLAGADAGNYMLSGPAATTADITVRPLSTWIGGATGNWSIASNWDALPDLSNVLAVTVPTGKTVTYDAAAGTTNLASLTAAGLNIAGGILNIANTLTVSSSFSQSGGTLGDFAGGSSASITQASGDLNLPKITVANLSLNAPAGAITQSGRIAALTLNTQSQGATTLTDSDNQITNRVDMSAGGPLKLWASGDLNLGTINAGANPVEIKASHDVILANGNVTATNATVSAGNDMHLNGSGITAGNDIFINLLGATSTLYLNDSAALPPSFLWAQAPSTIHLDFPARVSGGMVVNGVAVDPLTFVSVPGESGLFYGAAMTPARQGAGLALTYSGKVAGTATTTTAPTGADAVLAAISATTTPLTRLTGVLPFGTFPGNSQTGSGVTPGSDQTAGGTAGTFGGSDTKEDDKEDKNKKDADTGPKKQADKPTTKKLATCS